MDIERKLKVRKFYEQKYLKFCQEGGYDWSMCEFKWDSRIATYGFNPESYEWENLDEEERLLLEEKLSYRESPSALSISIREKLEAPDSLLQACDRICWYLKTELWCINSYQSYC